MFQHLGLNLPPGSLSGNCGDAPVHLPTPASLQAPPANLPDQPNPAPTPVPGP